MFVYICENSIEGIFTGVYDAWASKHGHENVKLVSRSVGNFELFCEYITVLPDNEKATKVRRGICERMGYEVYVSICEAILAAEEIKKQDRYMDKADAIYKTILLGYAIPDGKKVLTYLKEPYVLKVFKLSMSAGNEGHHYLGFLRFAELENGVLFAKFHPKNNVLMMVVEHFADRFSEENFMIYDENRKIAAVHRKGMGYMLVDASDLQIISEDNYSDSEAFYQKLWKGFFENIAIEGRINPKLQSQNIPKRFWKDTVELSNL